MLIEIVVALNALSALVGGIFLFRLTKNYCVHLYELIYVLYFVVRPVVVSRFGVLSFDLVRFGIDNDTVLTYTLCGLVFSVVFHFVVLRAYARPKFFSDCIFRICDFDHVSVLRLMFVTVSFLGLTYLVNVYKFHSVTYFAQNLDSFEAGMDLAGGLWFVQVLSGILVFPTIVLLGRNVDTGLTKIAGSLVIGMSLFHVMAKPSTRTETISLLAAVAVYLFSVKKLRLNFLTIALVTTMMVGLLVFLDAVRQGHMLSGYGETSILSLLAGAYENLAPADNALILIDYLKHHSWLYFRYLAASLSPLSLIPSAIFPFKPRADIEGVLTYLLFGYDLDPSAYHEGGTLTYTVPGAGYADLGFGGVIVAAVIYGLIFSVFLRGWKEKSTTVKFLTTYYSILIIAGLRLSVEALMSTFYWVLLATGVMHFLAHSTMFSRVKRFPNSALRLGRPKTVL